MAKNLVDTKCFTKQPMILINNAGFPVLPCKLSREPVQLSSSSDRQSANASITVPCKVEEGLQPKEIISAITDSAPIKSISETKEKGKPIYKRNIFKSMVKNLTKYAKDFCEKITKNLLESGYPLQTIKDALFVINDYKMMDDTRGDRGKYRRLLADILKGKSILTRILRDSLEHKISIMNIGKHGRITLDNFLIYKKAYVEYLEVVSRALEEMESKDLNETSNLLVGIKEEK